MYAGVKPAATVPHECSTWLPVSPPCARRQHQPTWSARTCPRFLYSRVEYQRNLFLGFRPWRQAHEPVHSMLPSQSSDSGNELRYSTWKRPSPVHELLSPGVQNSRPGLPKLIVGCPKDCAGRPECLAAGRDSVWASLNRFSGMEPLPRRSENPIRRSKTASWIAKTPPWQANIPFWRSFPSHQHIKSRFSSHSVAKLLYRSWAVTPIIWNGWPVQYRHQQ